MFRLKLMGKGEIDHLVIRTGVTHTIIRFARYNGERVFRNLNFYGPIYRRIEGTTKTKTITLPSLSFVNIIVQLEIHEVQQSINQWLPIITVDNKDVYVSIRWR